MIFSEAMHSLNSMVPSPDSSLPHDGKDGSLRSDDSQKYGRNICIANKFYPSCDIDYWFVN